jgi:hypothetical protein
VHQARAAVGAVGAQRAWWRWRHPAHGAKARGKALVYTAITRTVVPPRISRRVLWYPFHVGIILVVAVVVWLTWKPVGVVPRSAVGPPPGALACHVIRTDPGIDGRRDDGPHSGVLRGAVDACIIAAERLARCAPSRPRADVWYVSEGRGRRWRRTGLATWVKASVVALAVV